jgi:hypothetical protein
MLGHLTLRTNAATIYQIRDVGGGRDCHIDMGGKPVSTSFSENNEKQKKGQFLIQNSIFKI